MAQEYSSETLYNYSNTIQTANDANMSYTITDGDNHEHNQDLERYRSIHKVCYSIIVPCILGFGILGNILNILILCQRRFQRASDKMERCAAHGFLFLAASDLLFCITGFPAAFLKEGISFAFSTEPMQVLAVVYYTYRAGLLNVFLFSSTWCTVIIAVERYLVVIHPLKARACVRLRRTIGYQVVIAVASIVCNIPHFLKLRIYVSRWDNNTVYSKGGTAIANIPFFGETYNILWNIFGAFIPLCVLCYCYVHLLCAIYRSRSKGMIHLDKYITSKITTILVLIVTLYFLLVCPSVILSFYVENYIQRSEEIDNFTFPIALVITNTLQALNFAVNFLLYFSMNPKFRAYLRCPSCASPPSVSYSNRRHEVIHLRVR